jgi:protein-L-isoaspartate(D-aspartate) O-methyltransferase
VNAQRLQGIGMTSARTRGRLIGRLWEEGIRDRRVLEAMLDIPRHIFVDEALESRAYEDNALPIGFGQTISQPFTVARMSEALLEGGPVQRVLEVGTGSGYQTAVLARLVERVYSVERIEALLNVARQRLRGMKLYNLILRHGDGALGLADFAPYDGILVTAAPTAVPEALLWQLAPGGRLILPVGGRNGQRLWRITRTSEGFHQEALERVVFVPLLGGVQ